MNCVCFLEYKLPKNIINSMYNFDLKQFSYIDDKNSINFLNNLDISKNNNELINKLLNIPNGDKKLFIKLLTIYMHGGLIINGNINIDNFDNLINLYNEGDLYLVKSCMFNNFFDGFLMAKPNNEIIYNILINYLNLLNSKKPLSEILYNDIIIYTLTNTNTKIKLLVEKIVNGVSHIYLNTEKIAEHHFSQEMPERLKIVKSTPADLKKLKIGITIDVPENLNSFYSNGIRQNSLYFYELLKNMNYDVKLIIPNCKNENVINSINFYNYEYVVLNDIFFEDFDIVFSFGFSLPKNIIDFLKKYGVKIVAYFCGNSYLIDSEKILYDQHKDRTIEYDFKDSFDIIWSIPQMYKQNKNYWEVIYRTKCIQVPFIWSTSSINFVKQIKGLTDNNALLYKQKNKNIAIFEPNISIMKWCLPCVFIAELTQRKYENINKVYMTNIDIDAKIENMTLNKFNMKQFNNICTKLDLFTNKKLSAERRYITLDFMENYADIAVSHQWENPLNYLYFDLAWMGWPILHNASLCKDIGYYYNDFDYDEGSEKLNEIILNHENNKTEYLNHNRKMIDSYLPSNVELQNKYRALIENLFL